MELYRSCKNAAVMHFGKNWFPKVAFFSDKFNKQKNEYHVIFLHDAEKPEPNLLFSLLTSVFKKKRIKFYYA